VRREHGTRDERDSEVALGSGGGQSSVLALSSYGGGQRSPGARVDDHTLVHATAVRLVERAVALGWAPSRMLVIDEDLRHSASGVDTGVGQPHG
jgi:hypothetical protein